MDGTRSGSLPEIPGFELTGVLGMGAMSVVYRGVRDGNPYAVKVMNKVRSTLQVDAVMRFRREAAAIARLNHRGIVRVIEVNEHQSQPYLVMELVNGQTLAEVIKQQGPLSEPDLLWVSKSLAEALAEVHRRGMVHQDIKPSNIILEPDKTAKIIDFGFVTRLDELEGNQEVRGTFLYSAPEQTGLLKRGVDGRSDLYALGAVMFECATGRPPFRAASVSELLQMHMAVAAPSVHDLNPQIRPLLGESIAKLLAKEPDDRYQSADGLLWDLQHLPELEAARAAGKAARLGANEPQLRAAEIPLIGRTDEYASLTRLWERARGGKITTVQVEGEGGLGKTRLVRDLVHQARKDGALILMGKAQQAERTPFGPLREAIDAHVARVQRLSGEEKDRAIQAIRKAAGEFAAIVKRFSQNLEQVLGEVPDVRPLSPADEQERFYAKTAEFFVGLAREQGPTIVLIDDVQWLDDGTLEVLKRIANSLESAPLCLATTARNDPASEPGRKRFVETLKAGLTERLVLSPLGITAVGDLIAAHLGNKKLDQVAVEQLASKANGNPFAVGEYVRALLERGLLRPTVNSWTIDLDKFHEISLPSDVVELLLGRLESLGEDGLRILMLASVIGFEFGFALLVEASGGKEEPVRRVIQSALLAGLLESAEQGYRFIHDRVHEALTKRLPADQARAFHQAVAESLEKHADDSRARVFALARHYAQGQTDRQPRRVYETSLQAGIQALAVHSNQEAYEFLERAVKFAEQLKVQGPVMASVQEAFAVSCINTGRQGPAREILQKLLAAAPNPKDQTRLHSLIGQSYFREAKYVEAWEGLQRVLALLGAGMPRTKIGQFFSLLWIWLVALVRSKTGWGFGKAREGERMRRQLVSATHSAAIFSLTLLGQKWPLMQVEVREFLNSHFLGSSRENALAHAYYAILLAQLGRLEASERHWQSARSMLDQLGDNGASSAATAPLMLSLAVRGRVKAAADYLDDRQVQLIRKYGNPYEFGAASINYFTDALVLGWVRQSSERVAQGFMPAYAAANFMPGMILGGAFLFAAHSALGHVREAQGAKDQLAKVPFKVLSVSTRLRALMFIIFGLLEAEEFGQEMEERIQAVLELGPPSDPGLWMTFPLIAYVRLEQFLRADAVTRKTKLRAFRKAVEALKLGEGRPAFACHFLALRAALARAQGRHRHALRLLETAEPLAQAEQSQWALWVIARERARTLAVRGNQEGAREQAKLALELANKEGWVTRSKQVRREFALEPKAPEQARQRSDFSASISVGSVATSVTRRALAKERYAEALLQVSLASASTVDPAEQSRAAMDELVQVLGAERAFLFVLDPHSGALNLQAARDAEKRDIPGLSGYSTTVVAKVQDTRKPLVLTGTEEGEAIGSESAVAHNLRSIMAAPLMLRERLTGVVYLDSRLAKGLFDKEDLNILVAIGNHIAIALETSRVAQVEAQQRALQKDLELTAAVQSFFLPQELSFQSAKLELRGLYRPAGMCSGDWWWHDTSPQGVNVFVGDVTGHGPPSAMMTAAAASIYRAWRRANPAGEINRVLPALNTELHAIAGGSYGMTLSALTFEEEKNRVSWLSAGAPPVLLLNAQGQVEALNRPGTPLGASTEFTPGRIERPLIPGDRYLLFTDGAVELDMQDGRQLGMRRFSKLLADTRQLPLKGAVDKLAAELDTIRGGKPLQDDITMVMIDVRAAA